MFTVTVAGKDFGSFDLFHDAVDAAGAAAGYTLTAAVITDTATGRVAVGLEEAKDWDDILWALPEGAPEEESDNRPFDWERDLGSSITPADCVTQAAEIDQDLATYAAVLAADVSVSWSRMHPDAGDPPADLEEGILAALEDAARMPDRDEDESAGGDVDERVTDALAARRYEF